MMMVGMKFRDIPSGKWFQDGSGHRMLKLQECNGAVNFHYTSFSLPKDYGCENAPLSVQRLPMVNEYMHDNTMLPSYVRANESNSVNVQFNGFNAVDEKGCICRCPLDVEFYVERDDPKDGLISMLRDKISRLSNSNVDQSCAISEIQEYCQTKINTVSSGPADDFHYQREQGAADLAEEILDILEENNVA